MPEKNNLKYEIPPAIKERGGESPFPSMLEEICYREMLEKEKIDEEKRYSNGMDYFSKD